MERPPVWLFPGQLPAAPFSSDSARQIFSRAWGDAGPTKHCTPHTLRHCFATHLLEAGVDAVVIQQRLGHQSIRTTSRYTHVSTAHLQNIASPLDLLPDLLTLSAGKGE